MADDNPSSTNTPPSDLTHIDKLLKSNAPKTPEKPQRPAPLTPQQRRQRVAEMRVYEMASPPKPARAAPPPPSNAPGKGDLASEDGEGIYSAEPLKSKGASPSPAQGLPKKSERRTSKPSVISIRSPTKIAGKRLSESYNKARNAIYPPLATPETDSEHEGDGRYMMSGGLQGNDRSEREHNGRKPRKSCFKEEFSHDEEGTTLVDAPLLGDEKKTITEGKTGKDGMGKEKKEIKVKRKDKRTTIRENGRVVDSESEEEYYESNGPVSGCVVG